MAKELFCVESEIDLSSVNIANLYKEAKEQTVITLAFNSLPKETANIDTEAYLKWQNTAFSLMQKSIKNNQANVALTKLLDDNGFEHSTIKGYTSAYFYKNPMLRQMGDIDFLVKKEDVEKVTELLIANGYERFDDDHDLHIGFKKNGIIYELHTSVTSVPDGKEYILDSLSDTMQKARYVDSSCGKIKVACDLHHGIVMLMHMQRHMIISSGIGIRHLSDWAVFVNSFENDEWVETFEKELKKIGLWKFAKVISKSAEIFLKMPSKPWFENESTELATSLAKEIFTSGNFGAKNETSKQEYVFIDHRGAKKGKIGRLFAGITRKVYSWKPFYEKHKWLLTYYQVCRWCRLLFRGRIKYSFHELKTNATMSEEKQRRTVDLLKTLELY